ncbi:hypothetical protein INT80_09795 [Gallibacterium anatis]|uniref:Uncharacterized protein n=1 Tax=Gallibacterium anatis TaxID=750 RepID=A0A930URR3_9PAST|nr:hypothetical protein [Gallibacterium anatis]
MTLLKRIVILRFARSYPSLPDQSMIMRKFCSAKLMLVFPKLISKPLSDISLCKIILAVATATAQKRLNYQWKLKHHTLGWQTVNYQPN